MTVMQTIKFLLPIAVIVLSNLGQMVRSQFTADEDIKECFIGVHCLLGPEVLNRAISECAYVLDQEKINQLEEWIEMEGYEGLVGLPLEEFFGAVCAFTEEEMDKIMAPVSTKFLNEYSEKCKNPSDPDCKLYNDLTDCYFNIYGEEKPKNNCGYKLV